jgi:hypothetical protein
MRGDVWGEGAGCWFSFRGRRRRNMGGEGRVDGQDILTITNGITNEIISSVALSVILLVLFTHHYTDSPV